MLIAIWLALAGLTEPSARDAAPPAAVHALAPGGWLVETPEALVAVDPLEAAPLLARARSLHKPLAGVLLTHAPDAPDELDKLIGVDRFAPPSLKLAGAREAKPNLPLLLGGASFTVHELGAGATAADAVWVLLERRPAAFVGQLVREGAEPPKESAAWLDQLDRCKRLLYGVPRFFPGKGAEGNYALLEKQRKVLLGVVSPAR